MMRRYCTLALLTTVLLFFATQAGWTGNANWRAFQEPEFGARIAYPAAMFSSLARVEGAIDQVFVSPDGAARLAIAA